MQRPVMHDHSQSDVRIADESSRLLVSVHMPKTAGTSFAATLQASFGSRYRADYADMPMQVRPWCRQGHALLQALRQPTDGIRDAECIHGHFLPAKYASLSRLRRLGFITWLRDPVERVLSHYHFWRRDYDGRDARQPLRNRMVKEGWSLERFALGAELRNVYSQYLWHFDLRRFDFIGITERYREDLADFSARFLGSPAVPTTAMANPHRPGERYDIDPLLRRRIEAHHAVDVALYRSVLERRMAPARWAH